MNRLILIVIAIFTSSIIFAQSLNELQKKYEESRANGDLNQEIFYLNKIAYEYWTSGDLSKATSSYKTLLDLTKKQGNSSGIRAVYTNLGLVYSDQSNYPQAIAAFNKSLELAKSQENKAAIASTTINLAVAYQGANDNNNALKYTDKALLLAKELNQMGLVRTCYGMLAEIHKKLGNTEQTMEYFNLYSSFDKHIKEQEMEKMKKESEEVVQQAQSEKYKTEQELTKERKKLQATEDTLAQIAKLSEEQKQIIQLKNEKEKQYQAKLRSEAIIRYLLLGIAVIIFIFAFFIYKQVKQTRKANVALSHRNKEIREQRDEISEQAEKIRSSIQYAQRIQSAVLPPEEMFEHYLNEYFVLFKPRDIVSGDFYWMTEKNEKLIVAAADCTGHGVPGAFMSMLGVAFLNEIVNKMIDNKHVKSLQASEILLNLRDYVIRSLHQKGSIHEAKDGMDIALVIINKRTNEMQYAGANNPLYLIRDNELQVFKGDPMSISYNRDNTKEYTNYTIQANPDDIIYMFSDGYQDQFGGKNGRKFMVKRFKKMLLEIHTESLDKQKHILDRTIMEWKKGHTQVDDMLIIGLKMNFKDIDPIKKEEYNWADKKILIAEDTEANYLYLIEALRKSQVKIIRARNGQEAINMAMENDIDLVLMDMNMPVIDGFEATEKIKEKKRKLPIIAQTALNISDVENNAKKAGCDDIIYKPVKLKLFLKIINKYM